MKDKRRGLGRGLAALLPAAEPEAVKTLPVGKLAPNRRQPRRRFDDAGIDGLAESIRAQGVIQPIIVSRLNTDTYTIIAGERRWRAAQRAGLAEVPVVVREIGDDRQLLEMALVENLQRADLNPLEEAEAYRALIGEFGLSQEEVAQRVGRTRATVSNVLRLLKLPPVVQEMLRSGELSAGQARPLLTLDDAEAIERLARRIVDESLSARAVEELTSPRTGAARVRRVRTVEPNTAAAAERLTRQLQTRVEIERRGQGGVVKIHFHSEEELMRLFDALSESRRR